MLAAEAGRGDVAWRHAMQLWCSFGSSKVAQGRLARSMERVYHLPFEKFARYSPAGSPEEIATFLQPYVDAGCRTFNLLTVGPDGEARPRAV